MINVAAFAGDLFALGLLSLQTVHDRIIHNLAYAPVVSAVHCRALYVFLLHAKAHIGPSIGMGKLGKVRKQLIVCMNACPMLYEPKVRLWVVVSWMNRARFTVVLTNITGMLRGHQTDGRTGLHCAARWKT